MTDNNEQHTDADAHLTAGHLATGPRIAVLGGGISGLLAALRLVQVIPHAHVEVFEAASRLGGKLRTEDFAWGPVEVGAEAFVVRRSEALNLVHELGLAEYLRHPAGRRPALYIDGALQAMPSNQVFGIPGEAAELTHLCDAATIEKVQKEAEEPFSWQPGDDAAVGELVAQRYGAQVVDRLVDPMLGGVYAASSRQLGLRSVAPHLAAALDQQAADTGKASLQQAVAAVRSTAVAGPVFGTLAGGYRRLIDALKQAIEDTGRGVIHCGTRVRGLSRDVSSDGRVRALINTERAIRDAADGPFDGVVCALPAPDAASVLDAIAPRVSAALTRVRCASSAVVTCVMQPTVDVPELSGVLVAADAGRRAKAMTLSSRKWAHLDRTHEGRGHVLRVSFGRLDDEEVLELSDAELFTLACEEMKAIAGITPEVQEHAVTRWIEGLPVPGPGHDALIREVNAVAAESELPLVLAGAALQGVGVPVCIATAEAAAHRLAARWQD